ncbi:MAG: PRD domain-containing protein [Treponema sp.]|nr:PRD domain-containing protein [Treponema sp.]
MIFDERLHILLTGNVISAEVETTVRRVIERLQDCWQIQLTEENGGRMVTHLAMALMRIERGEEIRAPEKDILEEFENLDIFPVSQTIVQDLIDWTPMNLPKAEQDYLTVNICLLLN